MAESLWDRGSPRAAPQPQQYPADPHGFAEMEEPVAAMFAGAGAGGGAGGGYGDDTHFHSGTEARNGYGNDDRWHSHSHDTTAGT